MSDALRMCSLRTISAETTNNKAEMKKRTRRPGPKVKTGCITCKIRRVKCDEGKPECSTCKSTGRKCDGYSSPPAMQILTPASFSSLIKVDKSLNSLASNPEEARYLEYYFHCAGPSLSGNLDSNLWMRLVLHFAFEEPAIRHAAMAISYLYETEVEHQKLGHAVALPIERENFFLKHYNEAITCLVARMQTRSNSLEISLVTCVLFICLEMLRKQDSNFAFAHFKSGLDIVAGLRSRKRLKISASVSSNTMKMKASSDGLDNTTLAFVEDNIVPAFARMAITALLFGQNIRQLYPPSCESEALPTLPRVFANLQDARLSLVDIMNLSLIFIAEDSWKKYTNAFTSQDLLHHSHLCTHIAQWSLAFEASAPSLCTTPALSESATVLRVLHTATSIWLICCTDPTEMAYDAHLPAFTRLVALASRVLESQILPTATAPQLPSSSSFSFKIALVAPLYFTTVRCRDPHTRRAALAFLRRYPQREGLWEPQRCAAVAADVIRREEAGLNGDAGEWPGERARVHATPFSLRSMM